MAQTTMSNVPINTPRRAFIRLVGLFSCALLIAALPGCAAFKLAGAMGQSFEYQKKIEVLPQYDGLKNKSVAVVVVTDMATRYEYGDLTSNVLGGVSGRLAQNVPGVTVLDPRYVLQWQYRTPQWEAMAYGEIAAELNVERVVYVDIYEYRLNPPGNRWQWEGVAAATIGVIERDSYDPDMFVETFNIETRFPDIRGLDRDSATASQIESGLLSKFVKETAWLFHKHVEPKYPDKYRPELDTES